jgi:hypothetical protein
MESGIPTVCRASASSSSFVGFAKEKRSEIAMDCGSAAVSCFARVDRSSVVGDLRILPSAAVRSSTPKRRSLGTSGSMRSKKKS